MEFNTNLIISGTLLDKIDLPDTYRAIELGSIKTSNPDHNLMAYTVVPTEKSVKNWTNY